MIKTWQICKSKKAEAEKLSVHFLKAQNTLHVSDLSHYGKEKQKVYSCFSRVRMLLGIRPESKLLLIAEGARLENNPCRPEKVLQIFDKKKVNTLQCKTHEMWFLQ